MRTAGKHWGLLSLLLLAAAFLLTGCGGSIEKRMTADFVKVTDVSKLKIDSGLNYSQKLDSYEYLYFYKGDMSTAKVALSKALSRVYYQAESDKQQVFEVGDNYGIMEKATYRNVDGILIYIARTDRARNRHYNVFVPYFGSGSIRMSGSNVNKKSTTIDTGSYNGGVYDDDDDGGNTSVFGSSTNTVKGGSTGVGK